MDKRNPWVVLAIIIGNILGVIIYFPELIKILIIWPIKNKFLIWKAHRALDRVDKKIEKYLKSKLK